MRDSTTISETQPSVSTSRLLLPPSVTDLGSQRELPTTTAALPPQLNQVQGGFGDGVLPDQDHLSSSSAGTVPNGQALDDPALLQRALMRPPPRLTRRSYTKVKKKTIEFHCNTRDSISQTDKWRFPTTVALYISRIFM